MEYKLITFTIDLDHSYEFRVRKDINNSDFYNDKGYPSQKLLDSLPQFMKLYFSDDELEYADVNIRYINDLTFLDI